MNKDQGRAVWRESIEKYGKETQSIVCMEECSELIQAVSKRLRGKAIQANASRRSIHRRRGREMSVLYHGGVPDLKPGDIIEPGHSRDNYDDCPICRARREKGADAIEGTGHQEQVYCTTMRDYAAEYAAIYGKGDVYQVRPIGDLIESDEDFDGCYRCDRLQIVRTVEKHVVLTPKRRRKIIRLMQRLGGPCLNPLPRNATPEMIERWAAREYADMRNIMREAERSIE